MRGLRSVRSGVIAVSIVGASPCDDDSDSAQPERSSKSDHGYIKKGEQRIVRIPPTAGPLLPAVRTRRQQGQRDGPSEVDRGSGSDESSSFSSSARKRSPSSGM